MIKELGVEMGYKEFVAKIMKSFDVLRARFEPLRSGVELTKDWVAVQDSSTYK